MCDITVTAVQNKIEEIQALSNETTEMTLTQLLTSFYNIVTQRRAITARKRKVAEYQGLIDQGEDEIQQLEVKLARIPRKI
jgi:hypothetical protein